jgi:hypothetical protein
MPYPLKANKITKVSAPKLRRLRRAASGELVILKRAASPLRDLTRSSLWNIVAAILYSACIEGVAVYAIESFADVRAALAARNSLRLLAAQSFLISP